MPDRLGVAVHGAGWVSGEHTRWFSANPHTEVRCISSRKLESAQRRRDEAGLKCDVSADFEKVLARKDIDIVAVCTPNHLHAAETIAAAQAGKHVLIEKPVALNLDDLKAMRDTVRKAKVKTVVSFVLRWNPMFDTVKALLADDAIGRVFYARVNYLHEIGPWYSGYEWARRSETSGTAMLCGGCHAADALRWFAGEVSEVTAFHCRGHRQDFEYMPTLMGTLQLANGGVGHLGASFEIEMPYSFPVELFGSKGSIRDNKVWSKGKFPGQTGWAEIPTVPPDSGAVSHHPFQGEINHFVDCILNDVESHCNLEDAVKTHELCIALDMSAEQGGKPIKLPLL